MYDFVIGFKTSFIVHTLFPFEDRLLAINWAASGPSCGMVQWLFLEYNDTSLFRCDRSHPGLPALGYAEEKKIENLWCRAFLGLAPPRG